MTLEILGLGGAKEVGRSSFLLTEDSHSLLLDAGLKLFPKRLNMPPLEPNIPLNKRKDFFSSLDSILVSHAHLDHIGYIPAAYHYGYTGKIVMTKPTADLANLVWADALKIEGERFFNRKDVEQTKKNIISVDYGQKFRLTDKVKAIFHDAGHILGSAAIELDWDGQRILYTGDISDQQSLLHTGHKIPLTGEKFSFIISEATNHHTAHHTPKNKVVKGLTQAILQNYKRSGKFVIPAFSTGRSQEVLSILMTFLDDLLYSYPIYMAGAINKVNVVYRKYFNANWINSDIIEMVKEQDKSFDTPWDHPGIKETRGVKQAKSIMRDKKPKIVVTTHGMVETGPVHSFLTIGGHNKNNTLAFVGYQALGSIGADILAGVNNIELGYGKYTKKCKIELNKMKFGFSGHISRENLQKFLTNAQTNQIFTVHGDINSMTHLRNKLRNNGLLATVLPSMESTSA